MLGTTPTKSKAMTASSQTKPPSQFEDSVSYGFYSGADPGI